MRQGALVVLSAALLGLCAAADGHDLYITAYDWAPPVPGRIIAYFGASHTFPVPEYLPWSQEMELLEAVRPDGSVRSLPIGGPMLARVEIPIQKAGTWLVCAQTRFGYVSFAGGRAYMKPKSQVKGAESGFKYKLSAKAVICAGTGGPSIETKPVGLELEIVPLQPMRGLREGQRVGVQVLFRGKPLAGAKIHATYAGYSLEPERYALTYVADKRGRAWISLIRRGAWLVVVDHSLASDRPQDYDAISFSSTLTFGVGARPQRRAQAPRQQRGRVFLVGMGPGPRDLLTVRAVETLRAADAVVCPLWGGENIWLRDYPDLLAGKQVLEVDGWAFMYYGVPEQYIPASQCEKARRYAQERRRIIAAIRDLVRRGKTVAILDSGDPLICGPCVWYLQELADLRPEVIPGVSSFNAANAALQRDVVMGPGTGACILSAHDFPGRRDTIEALAQHRSTMVFFTMKLPLRELVAKLRRHYPANTPVAIVLYAGDRKRQRVIRGTLADIVTKPGVDKLPFEHIIYVGDFLR